MSRELIDLNDDLKRLHEEGYELEVRGSCLLVHSVPYLNSKKEIKYGILVSQLELAGDKTVKPQDHTTHFIGEHPHDREGNVITAIQNASGDKDLGEGIVINHTFSNKPQNGYSDYFEKMTNYIKIVSYQAASVDPQVTAKVFKTVEEGGSESPFNYIDTNSGRAEIDAISAKLKKLKIGIIGLGGTGSYILDLVSKTPVGEIHIFDKDIFLSHNAFRAPGAASVEKLRELNSKVKYLHEIYSKIHKYIYPHEFNIIAANLGELPSLDFIFICVDSGEDKKILIEKLIADRVPFIDTGIGINAINGLLTGSVRTTTCTPEKSDHINKRISFANTKNDDYDKNIQIAELNSLNASLAVIKWKKFFGFYHDLEKEHNSDYNINVNKIINDEADS